MSNDDSTPVTRAIQVFMERRASSNPVSLREYLRELAEAGSLTQQQILAVADAITWAYEQGEMT